MRLTKQQSRQRWAELQQLVWEWDPIGVRDSAPEGEYDCLVGPVMRLLEQSANAAEIAEYLREEVREHMGLNDPGDVDGFAAKAKSWFEEEWKNTFV